MISCVTSLRLDPDKHANAAKLWRLTEVRATKCTVSPSTFCWQTSSIQYRRMHSHELTVVMQERKKVSSVDLQYSMSCTSSMTWINCRPVIHVKHEFCCANGHGTRLLGAKKPVPPLLDCSTTDSTTCLNQSLALLFFGLSCFKALRILLKTQ
jgi:hypothetical protein